MQNRIYDFSPGFETSAQPDAGTPADPNDLITLSWIEANYYGKPKVTGSKASPSNIVAITGIVYSTEDYEWQQIMFIQGSGGAVDISANPQIQVGDKAGERLMLIGCSNTNTVLLEHGNGLILNGECILKDGSMIELMWSGVEWIEIARNMA